MTVMLMLALALGPQQDGAAPERIVFAAGYVPNVQFAPFYVAQTRGYYRQEGLELAIDYTVGPDVLKLTALNKAQIASADPDAFLNAAARGLPLVHVATLYQRYPIALIAREPIFETEKLRGKSIGVSGLFGSSYLGLKAMLAELGLKLSDVRARSIGFTQVAALQQKKVDAVVGYINHEPLLLRLAGVSPSTYTLSQGAELPGVGLMTSRKFLEKRPDLVEGFLRATFRGMHDVVEDPEACLDLIVASHLPELASSQRRETAFQTLQATLPYWGGAYVEANGYGQCDASAWSRLADLLDEVSGGDIRARWRDWLDRGFAWKPSP